MLPAAGVVDQRGHDDLGKRQSVARRCGHDRGVGQRVAHGFDEDLACPRGGLVAWLGGSAVEQAEDLGVGCAEGEQRRNEGSGEHASRLGEQPAVVVVGIRRDPDLLSRQVRAERAVDDDRVRAGLAGGEEDVQDACGLLDLDWPVVAKLDGDRDLAELDAAPGVLVQAAAVCADLEVVVVGDEERAVICVIRGDVDAVEPGAREAGDRQPSPSSSMVRVIAQRNVSVRSRGLDLDVDAFEVLEEQDRRDRELDEAVSELAALIGPEVCVQREAEEGAHACGSRASHSAGRSSSVAGKRIAGTRAGAGSPISCMRPLTGSVARWRPSRNA